MKPAQNRGSLILKNKKKLFTHELQDFSITPEIFRITSNDKNRIIHFRIYHNFVYNEAQDYHL